MKQKILLILMILLSTVVYAQWDDCPFGLVNDSYPGECARYVDTNNDGLCDKSQEYPLLEKTDVVEEPINSETVHYDFITGQELKTKTVEEVAVLYSIDPHEYAFALNEKYPGANIHCSTSFQYLHDSFGLEPSVAKDIAASLKSLTEPEISEENSTTAITTTATTSTTTTKSRNPYVVVPIVIVSLVLYIVSYILTKKNIFKLKYHVKLWNYLLMISFLVSGILGIMLVMRINYGFFLRLPFNMLFWHVEFGIAMAILAFFHMWWYSKFRLFFKRFF